MTTNSDALARLRELAQDALTVQYELDDRYLTIIRNGESVVGLLGELATASLALLDRLAAAKEDAATNQLIVQELMEAIAIRDELVDNISRRLAAAEGDRERLAKLLRQRDAWISIAIDLGTDAGAVEGWLILSAESDDALRAARAASGDSGGGK